MTGQSLPLRLAHVSYQAGGRTLLDSVSFAIEAPSRVVILGPNGAGKSLLLRLCHGLIAPTVGEVRWSVPDSGRRQAMVFQQPTVLRRSVRANIRYGLGIRGVPRRMRGERIADALALTGLVALADKPAPVLSGGEQQRLALARAWALRPEVLLLDEPTASLDPAASRAVEDIIEKIFRAGTTIMLTTHDLAQARRMADVILFLHRGRLLEQAAAGMFFDHPQSAEAAAFLKGELIW